MSSSRLQSLFQLSDEGVAELAAEIQNSPDGLRQIPADEWLQILRIEEKPAALAAVCAIAAQFLPPSRLTLEQCIELACREPPPVAELGLKLAQMKPITGGPAVLTIARLGGAAVQNVRQDGVKWVIQVIERSPHSRTEHLRELLEAPFEDARRQAANVMTRSLRFKDAIELWTALARSPNKDARAFLILHLTRRKPGLAPGSLRHLWATTLIALAHVQGEVKRAVIDRVLHYLESHPEEAEAIHPLLEIAGVRQPPPLEPRPR